jgi:hypothetical protein
MHETNGCFFLYLNKVMCVWFFSRIINNCLLTFVQSCLPLLKNVVFGLCVYYSCAAVWQSSNCCPPTNLLYVTGTWHFTLKGVMWMPSVMPWRSQCTVHPYRYLAFHQLCTSKWNMFTYSLFLSITILGGGGHFVGTDHRVLPTVGPSICWLINKLA